MTRFKKIPFLTNQSNYTSKSHSQTAAHHKQYGNKTALTLHTERSVCYFHNLKFDYLTYLTPENTMIQDGQTMSEPVGICVQEGGGAIPF